MNARTKKILYGVVFAGATALLVPSLLESRRKVGPEAPPEIPAHGPVTMLEEGGGGAEERGRKPSATRASLLPRLDIPPPVEAESVEDVRPASSSVPRAEAQAEDTLSQESELEELASRSELVGSLQQSLGLLENFAPAASLPDLDQLATSWRSSSRPAVHGGESESDPLIHSSSSLAVDPLVEYLTDQRLSGIIHSEQDAVALIGGRVVHEGDELIPGRATLGSIGPRHVVFLWEGEEVRVDLPPLRPRSRSSSSQEDQGLEGEDSSVGSEGVGPENGGGSESSVEETNA